MTPARTFNVICFYAGLLILAIGVIASANI